MENKLLTYILQMQKQSSTQSVPRLAKAQRGGAIVPPADINRYDNIPNPATVRKNIMMPEQAAQQTAQQVARDKQGYIRNAEPDQSRLSRLGNMLTHPMTALSYKMQGKDIPDHFERGPQNILENATNIINPFGAVDAVSNVPSNLRKGQFLEAGLNLLSVVPWLQELKGAKSLAKEKGILKEIVNPETGKSSFITKPKPTVEPQTSFGRDDMGMFRRRGDSKTYILKNDGEFRMSPTISSRHPGFLNETEYNELQDLYNRPGVRENLQKEYSRMNLITDEHGNVPVLEHHLSSRNNYNDFIENQVEKAFYTRDNPVNNEGWPQGYSIGDSYSNSPSFADMYNNSLKRKFNLGLEKIDKSLGSLIPSKKAPNVNYEELENSINKRLASGMGIKKTSEPLSIKISKGSDNVMPNEFQTYINGQRSGGIGLRQNMDAYSNNKKLSEILFPNAQDAWRSAPGFRKTGDYPFNLTGKADEYYNKGLSGEFNAAINDVLKEKGYGNILSGGTGHTPLGKSRWDNLVNKGVAEKFGEKFNESFYKLKEDGGPIVDPMGQWAHPGQVTRIPSANITMQGVPYPVLGVASSGQQVMMQPGQDYNFGNAEYVDEYPMMANGGYTVTRSSDRKGKTHKVTGPGGVVKYFGDSKLGQHPKDPERKKAFYARHKSNLAGNPFFRAFARKTWADGGQTDDDREMLSGVADMLRRVNDVSNRKQIANYMMNNFREENVTFEPNKFLRSANAFGNAIPKAQTGKQVRSKPLFSQSQIDLYNRLVAEKEAAEKEAAEKEAAEKEAAAKKLAAMREYYENRPHFSQNNSPREEPTPWVDPVLGRIDRENNEKYADSDGGFENFLEFIDPTGISSWDDVSRTFRNPSASNLERGFALFSALPYVGKLGKLAKGTKAINTAVKGNALQKIGRGVLKGAAKTVDIVTGGPAMRYFDQTINPLSRGFGTLTEKAVGQIPYSGVRKAFEIGSDFNQMRRFQDGVLIPGFNQLDNYMTQPANSQKPWWKQ